MTGTTQGQRGEFKNKKWEKTADRKGSSSSNKYLVGLTQKKNFDGKEGTKNQLHPTRWRRIRDISPTKEEE